MPTAWTGAVTFAGTGALLGRTFFDPTFIGIGVRLSNSFLTVTATGITGANTASFSNAQSVGKVYCEFSIDTGADFSGVGVCNGSQLLNVSLSASLNAIGFFTDGNVYINNAVVATLVSFTSGDVISMAVDFGNATIWFSKNSGAWNNNIVNDPATNIGGISISSLNAGPYHAAAEVRASDQITVNFILPAFDPATLAWVAAVIAAGGTVSAAQEGYVDQLIRGLKANDLFGILDGLWLFASENEFQALIDIIALRQATAFDSPTFVANRGYTGVDGGPPTPYIDLNYNPVTQGVSYVANNDHFSAWCTTNIVVGSGGALIGNHAFSTIWDTIFGGGNNLVAGIQDNSFPTVVGNPVTRAGHWIVTRDSSTTERVDQNGSLFGSPNVTSTIIVSQNYFALAYNSAGPGTASSGSPNQVAMVSVGGSFSSSEALKYYNLLRAYMTSVGVP